MGGARLSGDHIASANEKRMIGYSARSSLALVMAPISIHVPSGSSASVSVLVRNPGHSLSSGATSLVMVGVSPGNLCTEIVQIHPSMLSPPRSNTNGSDLPLRTVWR